MILPFLTFLKKIPYVGFIFILLIIVFPFTLQFFIKKYASVLLMVIPFFTNDLIVQFEIIYGSSFVPVPPVTPFLDVKSSFPSIEIGG
jgi:hypothetical protein